MRETEKRNGLCAVERGRREEMKPLRSGWMLAACRSAIEMSRQGAAKGYVWVLDPTTARAWVWVTVTFIATKGHKDAQ